MTAATHWLERITDRWGNTVQFLRDSAGRVFEIVDDLGRRYHLSYYDHSRLAQVSDFTGRLTTLSYDLPEPGQVSEPSIFNAAKARKRRVPVRTRQRRV